MTDREKLLELHDAIAVQLNAIQDVCRERGLKKISRCTLCARDPDDDAMIVMLTNEPDDAAVRAAVEAALKWSSVT